MVALFTRRSALAVAGGTLATAAALRKPAHAELQDLGALLRRAPPAALPPITFVDANGSDHTLADFRGKGVVLNCWATWCMPCVEEMPALARLAVTVRDAGVVVLALSSDRGGAPAVERYFMDKGIKGLDVWLDPHGDAMRALGMRGIPTTLLVDHQGREQARIEGGVDWADAATIAQVKSLTSVA